MDNQQQVLKRAFVAHNAGRHEEAEVFCRTLVQAGLDDAQLFFLLGMVLHKTGRGAQAVQWLERAAQLQPGDARIFSGLGCVWQQLGDPAKAAGHFARAAGLEPQQANHFYSLGNVTYQLGELEQAAAAFQRAVELNPRDAESWNNLGKCLKELNRVDESIVAYDRALALQPGYLLARQGRSISLLTAGRLAEGFRDYELRWLTLQPRQFTVPRWAGQPIPGRTLFLHAEQGFGDGIQSARYARLARERCGRVILECRPELKTLFNYSGVADEVIAFGEEIPLCDFYTSVISLPGMLGITLENIPSRTPYLQTPPARELPPQAGNLRVGLAWAGSPAHNDDAARSLPLAMLAPVLAVSGVAFYSLQMPVPKRDELGGSGRVHRLSHHGLGSGVDGYGHFGGHVRGASGGCAGQTGLDVDSVCAGLAVVPAIRGTDTVVFHHAAVSPAPARRLACRNRPGGGGTVPSETGKTTLTGSRRDSTLLTCAEIWQRRLS